jgi:hypothetical protein
VLFSFLLSFVAVVVMTYFLSIFRGLKPALSFVKFVSLIYRPHGAVAGLSMAYSVIYIEYGNV